MKSVGLMRFQAVGLNETLTVGGMQQSLVGLSRIQRVGIKDSLKVGKTLSIEAGEAIKLVCGDSKLVLTPSTIHLDTPEITEAPELELETAPEIAGAPVKSFVTAEEGVAEGSGFGIRDAASIGVGVLPVVGHALSKHAGRNPEIWGKMNGSMNTWNDQSMKHFRDIIRGSVEFKKTTGNGIDFLEKRLNDGRGARLNMDHIFKTFID